MLRLCGRIATVVHVNWHGGMGHPEIIARDAAARDADANASVGEISMRIGSAWDCHKWRPA